MFTEEPVQTFIVLIADVSIPAEGFDFPRGGNIKRSVSLLLQKMLQLVRVHMKRRKRIVGVVRRRRNRQKILPPISMKVRIIPRTNCATKFCIWVMSLVTRVTNEPVPN